jgi:cell division septal protein FtsQ
MSIRKVQTQNEKIIDYQYIRGLKNKEVRKNRFKRSISQQIFRLVLLFVLASEVAYCGWQGVLYLKTSRSFLLQNVQVSGTEKLDPKEVKTLVLEKDRNALLMDLAEIKLRLESHPWIQSAIVWRELPSTVRVHITERRPAALLLCSNLYLVDDQAKIIDLFKQQPEYASLPVLTGINGTANTAQIRSSLEYLLVLSQDPAVLRQVSEIHTYDNDSTIVYLRNIPFGLLVSKNGILPVIKTFMSYADFVKKNFGDQKLIDLRYQGQIILKAAYKEQL